MKSLVRAFWAGLAFVATYFFVFWVPFSLILPGGRLGWIAVLGSLVAALLVARFVWLRTASVEQGLASAVFLGAAITGAAGFVAGFFGPIVFAPQANQGPLLGIFITGPLGALAGAIGGAIYWLVRRGRGGGTAR